MATRKADRAAKKRDTYILLPSPKTHHEPDVPPWVEEYGEACRDKDKLKLEEPLHIYKHVDDNIADGRAPEFGSPKVLQELFALDRLKCKHFLNAGASFRLAIETQSWYQLLLEQQPGDFKQATQVASRSVAKLVGAQERDIVPVISTTEGINAVLRSISWEPGDLVLVTSINDPGVNNAAARQCAEGGARIKVLNLDFETLTAGQESVFRKIQEVIEKYGQRMRLAVIDHTTSAPTFHMPIKKLAELCHRQSIGVCCNGSHAITAKPVDVPSLGVDYYTGNLHQWAACPNPIAFLWVKSHCQADFKQIDLKKLLTDEREGRCVVAVIEMPYFNLGQEVVFQGMQAQIPWPGTAHTSAWLAVPTALRVWEALGLEEARQHNHRKLLTAVHILKEEWGDHIAILGADDEHSHMASVEIPDLKDCAKDSEGAYELHLALREAFGIEIQIDFWQGRLWVRVCAQIFNVINDYVALRDAVSKLKA